MIALTGTVLNVYEAPEGTDKDGQTYGGGHKVQLQGEVTLRNGEQRIELHTLTCKEPEPFRKAKGRQVLVPVGAFSPGKGQIMFYITGTPQLVNSAS